MSFGLGDINPFKSHASSSDAGGGMGVYAKKKKKDEKKKKNSLLDMSEADDNEDFEVDISDDGFLT